MNIVIVSLHFSPAYIGHMKAWYKLCTECGHSVRAYFSKAYTGYFDGEEYEYLTDILDVERFNPDYAIVQNIGFENVDFFRWSKRNKCSLLYILHEPYMGLSELMKEASYAPKELVASMLNKWLCKKADQVIICSQYAKKNCSKYMKRIVKKLVYMPLLFLDNYDSQIKMNREYFSMIGTFAFSHGSDIFLDFIKEAYRRRIGMKFQIVSRSNLQDQLSDPIFKEMEDEGLLLIKHGKPLTEVEMCEAYRKSYAVWNGYRRTTQSGVLPNAFMQGSPVVATSLPSFTEFVVEGKNGTFIANMGYDEVINALERIRQNKEINEGCRHFFLKTFYYRSQEETFKKILDSSTPKMAKK